MRQVGILNAHLRTNEGRLGEVDFGIVGAVYCLVKIPHPVGGENEYLIDAASLFNAVRRALEINEGFVGQRPDDLIVTVIEDGQQAIYYGSEQHNATERKWWVRVGRVREASA